MEDKFHLKKWKELHDLIEKKIAKLEKDLESSMNRLYFADENAVYDLEKEDLDIYFETLRVDSSIQTLHKILHLMKNEEYKRLQESFGNYKEPLNNNWLLDI